jgi:hypothetical protein
MKTILRYVLPVLFVLILVFAVRNQYVLDSRKLHTDVINQLLPGTPKRQVIRFIQRRKPLFCDDEGAHVRARLSGRAGNLIYRKDIVLDFEFDANGNLLKCAETEFLSFL